MCLQAYMTVRTYRAALADQRPARAAVFLSSALALQAASPFVLPAGSYRPSAGPTAVQPGLLSSSSLALSLSLLAELRRSAAFWAEDKGLLSSSVCPPEDEVLSVEVLSVRAFLATRSAFLLPVRSRVPLVGDPTDRLMAERID
jgi:hypothetical protein